MRLLDRFLLRELVIPLAYCLGGFLMFWICWQLIDDMSKFQRWQLRASDIVEYYWALLPELLVTILPVALLLALLYTLTSHSRHHEITAMRAAGISLWRICVPYLAVGFLFSLLLFWLNERFTPDAKDRAEEIETRRTRASTSPKTVQSLNFRNARDHRIWTIGAYNPETTEMTNPQISWRLPDGSSRTLIARSGVHTNNAWQFSHVHLLAYSAPGFTNYIPPVRTNSMVIPEFTEKPSDLRVQIKFSRLNAAIASKRPQLSLEEIKYLETHLELNPRDAAILNTQLHARLAQPWTCLVVALIAIPFGAVSGRRNVFIGVAASIFLCFGFYIVQRLGLALASGGFIPAGIGAWLPNGLFGATGLWLTHRVK
jgi:lipopolysaccharide export system permease protein